MANSGGQTTTPERRRTARPRGAPGLLSYQRRREVNSTGLLCGVYSRVSANTQAKSPTSSSLVRPALIVARELGPPLAILALAAYLRLDDLWLVQFKQDEAVLANRALAFIEGGQLPLAGNPSGAGVFNPPGFVYLISLAMAVYRHPIAVSALLAVLGAFSAAGVYYLGRRYFGTIVGAAGGLLYAANPWAVWHSRSIWEPDSTHLFVVLFALAVLIWAADGRPACAGVAVVLLAVLTQLHFSTVVLAPVWLVALIVAWRVTKLRPLALGAGIAIALYLPYLWGQATSGWTDVARLLSQPAGQTMLDTTSLRLTLATITEFSYFLPDDLAGNGLLATTRALALRQGMLSLAAIGAVGCGWFLARGEGRARRASAILLAWIILPVAVTAPHWLTLQIHYFLVVLPALCLLAGVGAWVVAQMARAAISGATRLAGLTALPGRSSMAASALALALVASVVYAQTYASLAQREQIRLGNRARFNYGVPLLYTSRLADWLRAETIGPVEVIASHSYASEALATLTRERDRFLYFDGARAVRIPEDGEAVVVLEDGTPAARLLDEAWTGWRIQEVREADRRAYSVYRPPAFAGETLRRVAFSSTDVSVGEGLSLVGISYPKAVRPSDKITLGAYWRVAPGRTVGNDVAVAFLALETADGRELAKAQQHAHDPALDARGGDWIGWTELTVPADLPDGAGWLRFGLVWSPGARPLAVSTADGRPLGDSLRLGPVRLIGQRNAVAPPDHLVGVSFGTSIVLEGYDVEWLGPNLALRLHWRATGIVGADYQAFAHVVDEQGRLVGQRDTQPGQVPTSLWEAGEQFVDEHIVTPPTTGWPSRVRAVVGLYSLANGARLPVVGPDGVARGDSVTLDLPAR